MPPRLFTLSLMVCAALLAPLAHLMAHTVFVMPAPQVHVSASHQNFRGLHGRTNSAYARPGTRTIINGQVVFVGGYDPTFSARDGGPEPVPDAPVPSDAERYRIATGGSLPSSHGMVVLPAATPRGDVTYLWSNIGGD